MKIRPLMLSATFVENVNAPGRYGDGRGGLGLGLLVRPATHGGLNKSWTQSVRIDDRPTSLGLGRYPVVTLAMARERALDNARAIARGHDPRRTGKSVPTFAEALETVIAIHAANWKDRKGSEHQWRSSMRNYVLPRLERKRVDAVTTADVMAVLSPIWSSKRVTAQRLRQRIGAVMKWAHRAGATHGQPRRRGDLRRAAEEHCGAQAPAGPGARRGRGRVAAGAALRHVPESAPRVRVPGAHRRALGRGAQRPLGRDRPGRGGVDRARRAHEGRARASGAALAPGARSPRRRPRAGPTPTAGCSRRRPGAR